MSMWLEESPGAKSTVSIMPSLPGTSVQTLVIRRVTFADLGISAAKR